MKSIIDADLAMFHVDDILANGQRSGPHVDSLVDTFENCRQEGVAAYIGLIRMAEAIRADGHRWLRLNGWTLGADGSWWQA